jgi:hypothetical protein
MADVRLTFYFLSLKGPLLLREIREGSSTVFVIASLLLEIPASEGAELDGRQRWLLFLGDCSDASVGQIPFVTDGD